MANDAHIDAIKGQLQDLQSALNGTSAEAAALAVTTASYNMPAVTAKLNALVADLEPYRADLANTIALFVDCDNSV
jgi:hypothetical protein